jgi:hypothetical protein
MLRTNRTTLGARLERHGVGLRSDVLDDRRRLLNGPRPTGRMAEAIASLHQVLDDLGQAMRSGLPQAR